VTQPASPTPSGGQQADADKADAPRLLSIRKVLDEDVRPFVQADGGDIELISVDGPRVKVRLHGACETCPSSMVTLRQGVEARLRAKISPDIVVEELH
jgi:NifU-like protein